MGRKRTLALLRNWLPSRPQKKLFFLHIPKTAGTSFVASIHDWFQSAGAVDLKMAENADVLRRHPFVWGHITYDCFRSLKGNESFMTAVALREPLKRLTSHIQYCDRYNIPPYSEEFDILPDPVKEVVRALDKIDISNPDDLARFMAGMPTWGITAFQDLQVQFLTDTPRPPDFLPKPRVDRRQLDRAIENLGTFDFAFLTDHLDEGIARIAKEFGKTPPKTPERTNLGSYGRPIDINNSDIREVLAPWLKFDQELYEIAREKFASESS